MRMNTTRLCRPSDTGASWEVRLQLIRVVTFLARRSYCIYADTREINCIRAVEIIRISVQDAGWRWWWGCAQPIRCVSPWQREASDVTAPTAHSPLRLCNSSVAQLLITKALAPSASLWTRLVQLRLQHDDTLIHSTMTVSSHPVVIGYLRVHDMSSQRLVKLYKLKYAIWFHPV